MKSRITIVAAAVPPVMRLGDFVEQLQVDGWRVGIVLTPTAATWVDVDQLAKRSGHEVRVRKRLPHEPKTPRPDAVAALLSLNSLNKWALGIGDSTASGFLNESIGLDIPVVAAPIVSAKLRKHPAYARSVDTLSLTGVTMLDPDRIMTTEPDGAGTAAWSLLCDAVKLHAAGQNLAPFEPSTTDHLAGE